MRKSTLALLVGALPLWVSLFEAILDRRPPTPLLVLSLLVGFAGITAISFPDLREAAGADLWAVLALFLAPFTGERPPPAKERKLGVDDPWTDAPELGMLAKVFEQDVFNMSKVQRGLETTRKPGATFSNYQESKIRWLHDLFTKWVDEPAGLAAGESITSVSVSRGTR